MLAFIDAHNYIRIEFDGYIHDVSILNIPCTYDQTIGSNQYFYSATSIPLQQADKISINGITIPLQIGLVTLTDHFNETYQYDGPLGAIYHEDYTEFYVYSPVAKEIKVNVKGQLYSMTGNGIIYHTRLEGDLAFEPYYFDVRLVDTFKKVQDPYLKMTDTRNGVVIPSSYQAKKASIKQDKQNAIIYEAHVRDVTQTLSIEHRGLFLGLDEHDETLGYSFLEYVFDLGITHLQLLPIFDFEGVDPIYKSRFYNWGYNPKHYFALQPWFSSQPTQPKHTLLEGIHMMDAIHQKGLGIIMDVVYNHVFDMETYPYDHLVPGYFYRHDEHNQRSNGSYCGNEVESRRYMVRRLIIDSLKHFINTYDVDGFRFDLMGLHDVETMNLIHQELSLIKPNIFLYGEGWHMGDVLKDHEKASQQNHHLMPNIAHFNDTFRNHIKGELHGPKLGYGTGGKVDIDDLLLLLKGSPHVFKDPSYSMNYVECHDNMTLFDKQKKDGQHPNLYRQYQDFTNALIMLSEGMTFFHAGQEMYRSKQGVENSYQSPDHINQLVYEIGPHTSLFKQLAAFKKQTVHMKRDYYIKDGHIVIDLQDEHRAFQIIIKTHSSPYTIATTSCILHVSTMPTKTVENHIEIKHLGVYIFEKR